MNLEDLCQIKEAMKILSFETFRQFYGVLLDFNIGLYGDGPSVFSGRGYKEFEHYFIKKDDVNALLKIAYKNTTYIPIEDASDYLGISREKLNNFIDRGIIKLKCHIDPNYMCGIMPVGYCDSYKKSDGYFLRTVLEDFKNSEVPLVLLR